MADEEIARNVIDASPTKDFFISMLVKDIELVDAVADLVDNCVDGARRIRPEGNFKKLYVSVEVSKIEFRIEDNCGGIPADVARNYAFRFGRPKGFPAVKHSIGQFGIGMKRAFFKIGSKFTVESTSSSSHFTMSVDVDEWRKEEKDWEFIFDELLEGDEFAQRKKEFSVGTLISLTELLPGVAAEFELENFITRLAQKLASKHQNSLAAGLSITLNHDELAFTRPTLLSSKELRPIVESFKLPTGISVSLYAGISDSDPAAAGWYVFCNGRLILEADQSEKTGWGETRIAANGHRAKAKIPYYHNQFARFRGYIYFDSNNPAALPWNTTKTDVDLNAPAFQAARQKMVVAMRPVIDFLNNLDAERAPENKQRILTKSVEHAKAKALGMLKRSAAFVSPKPLVDKRVGPPTQKITYEKPQKQITAVKKKLRARTLRDVGEQTFDYYFRAECTD